MADIPGFNPNYMLVKTLSPTGEIVYGYYEYAHGIHAVTPTLGDFLPFRAQPEKICRCTGRVDAAGRFVYDHDMLDTQSGRLCEMVWDGSNWVMRYADGTACDEPGTLCGNICLDDQCRALFERQRGDG